jgi:hypothetical protein
MHAFFWLAPEIDKSRPEYREGVMSMCQFIGVKAAFADAAPAERPRLEWLAEQINLADFAFFDVTGADADCLIALGMAVESEAQPFALRDPDADSTYASALVTVARDYFGPDDFQRKVRAIITDVRGASTVQQRQLVEHIKAKLGKLGPLPLRGIAQEVGRHPVEIRPLIYSMVAERMLKKLSDKRWAKYTLPG